MRWYELANSNPVDPLKIPNQSIEKGTDSNGRRELLSPGDLKCVIARLKVSTARFNVSAAGNTIFNAAEGVNAVSEKVSVAFEKVSVAIDNVNVVYVQVGATTTPTTTTTTASTTTTTTSPSTLKELLFKSLLLQQLQQAHLSRLNHQKTKAKVAAKMQAEYDEEDRRLKAQEEANAAMWDKYEHIQASMEVDRLLAERLQAEERESLTDAEKAAQLMQLIKDRRNFFTEKRAEEKRNQPPTKTQQRRLMCTYLRNMEGYKQKYFTGKTFDEVQKLFDRSFKRVNTFVDMETEVVGSSQQRTDNQTAETTQETSKRATDEMESERTKKQKKDEEKEKT
ncbi:hypothetical protein Tco_1336269 [Tanacetum coccineum]